MLEDRQTHGGVEFAELSVDPDAMEILTPLVTEVAHVRDALGQHGIGDHNRSALGAVKYLGGMKTGDGGISVTHHSPTTKTRSEAMSGVIDDLQPALFGDGPDAIDVTGKTIDMRGQYPRRFRGDRRLYCRRSEGSLPFLISRVSLLLLIMIGKSQV